MVLFDLLRRAERATRVVDPDFAQALAARWAALPEHVKTPAQVLGRHAVGCEGTHGVFPRCDLACTPCYHSRDANRVRTDGAHTVAEVDRQMALLRRERGPHAHAQLIGGEVTLLAPDDHAETLRRMRVHGREPMSMSHGDFDPAYLTELALDAHGRRRLDRISFAGHFDMMMFGRRGIPRPASERELHPYRTRFVEMFRRLRAEHGVRYFLAHNMTVTPTNLDQVAEVVRATTAMGFGLLSFQPAAFVGDDRRWHEDYRQAGMDQVWTEIERGVGGPLEHRLFQHGDERCNRVAYGFYVGQRWHPILRAEDPRDVAVRDAFYRHLAATGYSNVPVPVVVAKLARAFLRRPRLLAMSARWFGRTLRRAGPLRVLRHGVRPVSYVVHQFMDAAEVAPAWAAMRRGEMSADPRVRAAQERLAACHYTMAHPDTGEIVPACVQHSVLDPVENQTLRRQLPIVEVRARTDGPGPAAPHAG